jgi:hypothetical protein
VQQAVVPDQAALVLLVLFQHLFYLAQFSLLPFFPLRHFLLFASHLLALLLPAFVQPLMALDQVQFVAGRRVRPPIDRLQVSGLVRLDFGQLVEGLPRLLDAGLQVAEVAQFALQVELRLVLGIFHFRRIINALSNCR